MSLRVVPERPNPSSFSHTTSSTSAPSAPGIHDTLRASVGPSATRHILTDDHSSSSSSNLPNAPESSHPLESRLKNWEATQHALRMQLLHRTYGVAEPLRRETELKTVRDGEWRPLALRGGRPGPSLHEDILLGRDDFITWDDIFAGDDTRRVPGVHDEMEKKLGI